MSQPPRLCAVGHVVPRAHLDGALEDPTHAESCLGCRPALADEDGHQLVCRWHGRRQRWAIAAAPDLVAHLRDHLQPGAASDDKVRGSRTPPAPISLAALAAADDLHAKLAGWVLVVLEERPDLHGPDWAGSLVVPRQRTRTRDGEVVYRDPRVVGVRGPMHDAHIETCTGCSCIHVKHAAGPHLRRCQRCPGCIPSGSAATIALARWLLTHLEWCLAQPWAAVFVTEIPAAVTTVRARWPIEERPARVPVPCPACGQRTLVRHAPKWAEAPITVACDRIECGHIVPETRYEHLTRLVQYMGRAAG